MDAMLQLKVPDDEVFAFEQALATRLLFPSSLLQALGGQRYLLAPQAAKRLFPGSTSAEMRGLLRAAGAQEVRQIKSADGIAKLTARREPDFVERFMASAPAVAAGDFDWHLTEVRLPEAWDLVGGVDAHAWSSIRVGHVDTGYTEHPALGPWQNGVSPTVRTDLDANFFDAVNEDPLSAREPDHGDGFPFHGTRTLCTLTGRDDLAPVRPYFGAAPGAEVVPVRDTNTILVDDQQPGIGSAIRHAVQSGCRVITISQGITVLVMGSVRDALDEAYERGVIVVCAAGQYLPYVVAPARLKHSIAVAGTIPGKQVWPLSSGGTSVDIAAPAEPIRVATTIFNGDYGYTYGDSYGTSYATPLVAGTAALWLAHRETELDALYPERWQRVEAFRHVLRATAQVPAGWDTQMFGAGVLDAAAAIAMPLPDAGALRRE